MDPLATAGIAFAGGLLAPLGAVCVLPLYPGYLAWLSGQGEKRDDSTYPLRFSLVVIAGIMVAFLATGFIVTWLLHASTSAAIGIISLVAFLILAGASTCLIADIDLSGILPSPKRFHAGGPYHDALLFGLFFGLIMLPCNPAPVILLFALSVTAADVLENITILIAFCTGVATPLLILSIIPVVTGHRITGFLAVHNRRIKLFCGMFMLALSLYYLFVVFRLHEIAGGYITGFTG